MAQVNYSVAILGEVRFVIWYLLMFHVWFANSAKVSSYNPSPNKIMKNKPINTHLQTSHFYINIVYFHIPSGFEYWEKTWYLILGGSRIHKIFTRTCTLERERDKKTHVKISRHKLFCPFVWDVNIFQILYFKGNFMEELNMSIECLGPKKTIV